MSKFEICIVEDNKVYCWDSVNQRAITAKIVEDNECKEKIPEKSIIKLMEKVIEAYG